MLLDPARGRAHGAPAVTQGVCRSTQSVLLASAPLVAPLVAPPGRMMERWSAHWIGIDGVVASRVQIVPRRIAVDSLHGAGGGAGRCEARASGGVDAAHTGLFPVVSDSSPKPEDVPPDHQRETMANNRSSDRKEFSGRHPPLRAYGARTGKRWVVIGGAARR